MTAVTLRRMQRKRQSERARAEDERPVVLIADDDEDILSLLALRLGHRGYHTITARNGRDALELALRLRPAAAVLDWMMPVMEGSDVCKRLKHDVRTARMPVILLTARASERDVRTGFEHGADEYLTKPFAIEELDGVLARLLRAG